MAVLTGNYLFIHVPKSAGRSILRFLGGETPGIPSHVPLCALRGTGLDDRFTFGFVRNPWDRMVSAYAFLCQKKLQPFESAEYQQAVRDMGFRKWLMEDAFFMDQDRYWQSESLPPFQRRSQMFWLDGCRFIGRVETIDADIARLEEAIDLRRGSGRLLPWRRRLPKINRSQRRDYASYYDDDARAFVSLHFAPEIERFGYVFI